MAAEGMEDFDSADRLATLTESALRRRGYATDMSRDADLVVVTSAAGVTSSGDEVPLKPAKMPDRPLTATPPPEDAFESVALFAMRSSEMTSEPARAANVELAGAPGKQNLSESAERIRVTIKAALMKEYRKHPGRFATIPAVWIVTVEGRVSLSQQAQFLEQAVDAAAVYFAENTKGPQLQRISLAPPQTPLAEVAARSEPDLRLDPLQ